MSWLVGSGAVPVLLHTVVTVLSVGVCVDGEKCCGMSMQRRRQYSAVSQCSALGTIRLLVTLSCGVRNYPRGSSVSSGSWPVVVSWRATSWRSRCSR